jgi:hypothetical protein
MKSLREMMPEMLAYINDQSLHMHNSREALEIYEGDLMDRVKKILQSTLSKEYYNTIKDRIIPINFMPKIVNKMSQVYNLSPNRKCVEQDFVDSYSNWIDINSIMQIADDYSNMAKAYAIEPYVNPKGKPCLRVMFPNEFTVMGTDPRDKTMPTIFIKFMGEYCKDKVYRGKQIQKYTEWFIAYSDTEILAFDADGDSREEITGMTEGINPVGRIPFVYGNRSRRCIIPTMDTDLVQMIKMFPVLFSDLGGAIMYSCFSVIYTVDLDSGDLKLSPNGFWDFKSNPDLQKTPMIGTIKPDADIDKVLRFLTNIMGAWAESRSIKIGAIGEMSGENMVSGFSKLIDNMDTFDIIKKQIPFFKREEKDLFHLLAVMNNQWLKTGEIDQDLYPIMEVSEFDVLNTFEATFDEPKVKEDRKAVVDTQVVELNNRLTTQKRAIQKINPDLDSEEIENLISEIQGEDNGI